MNSTLGGKSEEERLHLYYMETERVGDSKKVFESRDKQLEYVLGRFEDEFGMSFIEYWMDRKIAAAEGKIEAANVRELDAVMRKVLGDKQSTVMQLTGMSDEEKEKTAEEFVNGLLRK